MTTTTVRTHAVFCGNEFYDWLVNYSTLDHDLGLMAEYRGDLLNGVALEKFMAGKTKKRVSELTLDEWRIIHICELRTLYEKFAPEDAIAYLKNFLKDSDHLVYTIHPDVKNLLTGVLTLLEQEAPPKSLISQLIEQCLIFTKAIASKDDE